MIIKAKGGEKELELENFSLIWLNNTGRIETITHFNLMQGNKNSIMLRFEA